MPLQHDPCMTPPDLRKVLDKQLDSNNWLAQETDQVQVYPQVYPLLKHCNTASGFEGGK